MEKNKVEQDSQIKKGKSGQSAPEKNKEFKERKPGINDPDNNDPTREDKPPFIINKL